MKKHSALLLLLFVMAAAIPLTAWASASLNRMIRTENLIYADCDDEETEAWFHDAGDYLEMRLEWPWAGYVQILSSAAEPAGLTVRAGDREISVTAADGYAFAELNTMAETITVTNASDAEITILGAWDMTHVNPQLWLTLLSVCWGVSIALYGIWRSRLSLSGFALIMGFVTALVIWKGALKVHGWDEETHLSLTKRLAGLDGTDIRTWASTFSVWYVNYLPGAAGLRLGSMLGLPAVLAYRLGAWTQGFCYAALAAAAIRHTPKYRMTFLMFAASPTCIYLASCLGYDPPVIGAALLGLALLLEMYEKPGRASGTELLRLLLPLCLATLAKPVYSLLLLLLLFLPERKFQDRTALLRFRAYVLLLTAACLAALLLPGTYDNVRSGDGRFEGANAKLQWRFVQEHPLEALGIIGRFVLLSWPGLLLDAMFFWCDFFNPHEWALSVLAVLLALSPLCAAGEPQGTFLTGRRRLKLLALGLAIPLILTVTQFFVSTVVGSHDLRDMQGRYFLPVYMLYLLALMLPEKWRLRGAAASAWAGSAALAALTGVFLLGLHAM